MQQKRFVSARMDSFSGSAGLRRHEVAALSVLRLYARHLNCIRTSSYTNHRGCADSVVGTAEANDQRSPHGRSERWALL
jgi:hypothetical protein